MYWVGTPWATVTDSAAMMRTASSARHGVGVMIVVTTLAISSQARVMYATWAKGSGDSRRSPGWLSASVPRATAARLAWSKSAPFGLPVVPLVHTTATGSCGARSGHRCGGSPAHHVATSARSITSTPPTAGGNAVASGSVTTSTGAARSRMDAISPAPMRGLIPDVIAPRRSNAA